MFSDIRRTRRFQQKNASSPDPADSPAPPFSWKLLASLSSLQADDTDSSLDHTITSTAQSDRDLFLASLGYDRYSDPYFLPTS